MDRAATVFLDASEDEGGEEDKEGAEKEEGEKGAEEGRALALWHPTALHHLLFVLRADPSIRVRREAMRLLSSVAVPVGSQQVGACLPGLSVSAASSLLKGKPDTSMPSTPQAVALAA